MRWFLICESDARKLRNKEILQLQKKPKNNQTKKNCLPPNASLSISTYMIDKKEYEVSI